MDAPGRMDGRTDELTVRRTHTTCYIRSLGQPHNKDAQIQSKLYNALEPQYSSFKSFVAIFVVYALFVFISVAPPPYVEYALLPLILLGPFLVSGVFGGNLPWPLCFDEFVYFLLVETFKFTYQFTKIQIRPPPSF